MNTPTITDLETEIATFEVENQNKKTQQQVLAKISTQIPLANMRVDEARRTRDDCQKAHAAASLMIDVNNLSATTASRSKLDEAELQLIYRRQERQVLLDGLKLYEEKLDEIVKAINKSYLHIQEMAREMAKTQWSRDRFWKMGSTAEMEWRVGILEMLLARLSSADASTITALKLFFADKKFRATVVRGFQDVKTSPVAPVWSDEAGKMVDGHIDRKVRVFQKHEEIVVPGDLTNRHGFEQFLNGRLELVGA
jgi:hypothetical protein